MASRRMFSSACHRAYKRLRTTPARLKNETGLSVFSHRRPGGNEAGDPDRGGRCRIGGVLVFGDRGTGKSTAVRALASLLPPMKVVSGCRYHCDPAGNGARCSECQERGKLKELTTNLAPVPVVDMPLGVTETVWLAHSIWNARWRKASRHSSRPFGARASRLPLYRRGQLLEDHWSTSCSTSQHPAKTSSSRGPERSPSSAFCAGRHRKSGRGRTASATARPLRSVVEVATRPISRLA